MSTNASISVKYNGTIHTIYSHWDGYYEGGVGQILDDHYNTEEKAMELINMGDLSVLAPTIEDSVFYHRDRKLSQEECAPRVYKTQKQMKQYDNQEYNYLFSNGGWRHWRG